MAEGGEGQQQIVGADAQMASEGRWVAAGGPANALRVHRVVDHDGLAPRLRIFTLQLRRDDARRDADVLRSALDPGFPPLVKTVVRPGRAYGRRVGNGFGPEIST